MGLLIYSPGVILRGPQNNHLTAADHVHAVDKTNAHFACVHTARLCTDDGDPTTGLIPVRAVYHVRDRQQQQQR